MCHHITWNTVNENSHFKNDEMKEHLSLIVFLSFFYVKVYEKHIHVLWERKIDRASDREGEEKILILRFSLLWTITYIIIGNAADEI